MALELLRETPSPSKPDTTNRSLGLKFYLEGGAFELVRHLVDPYSFELVYVPRDRTSLPFLGGGCGAAVQRERPRELRAQGQLLPDAAQQSLPE